MCADGSSVGRSGPRCEFICSSPGTATRVTLPPEPAPLVPPCPATTTSKSDRNTLVLCPKDTM